MEKSYKQKKEEQTNQTLRAANLIKQGIIIKKLYERRIPIKDMHRYFGISLGWFYSLEKRKWTDEREQNNKK